MIDGPIVAEVRRHRAAILESFGGDLHYYLAALQKSQAQRFAGRLVTLTGKRAGRTIRCTEPPPGASRSIAQGISEAGLAAKARSRRRSVSSSVGHYEHRSHHLLRRSEE